MQTISYSEARNSLKTLCDEVRESHEPALITRKGGDVVLIGAEDWEAINETLAITDIQGAVERITSASDYEILESNDKDGLQALIDA